MTIYRQIHCLVWNDDTFIDLNDDTKLIWFHLLTTTYGNQLGLFKASLGALADEMRWTKERYRDAIRHAIRHGMLDGCEKHQMIFIRNFLRYNQPTSPNSCKKWIGILSELPECKLKHEWYQALKKNKYGIQDGILHAILDGFKNHVTCISKPCQMLFKTMPDPGTETETETRTLKKIQKESSAQELNNSATTVSSEIIKKTKPKKSESKTNRTDPVINVECASQHSTTLKLDNNKKINNNKHQILEVFDYWKKIMGHHKAILDNNRTRSIEKALKNFDVNDLKLSIKGCSLSEWHMGANPDNRTYDSLDLILRNADKIEKFISIAKRPQVKEKSGFEKFLEEDGEQNEQSKSKNEKGGIPEAV